MEIKQRDNNRGSIHICFAELTWLFPFRVEKNLLNVSEFLL
jgi:hypothetical protein